MLTYPTHDRNCISSGFMFSLEEEVITTSRQMKMCYFFNQTWHEEKIFVHLVERRETIVLHCGSTLSYISGSGLYEAITSSADHVICLIKCVF